MSVTLNVNNNSSQWIGIGFDNIANGWLFDSLTFNPKPSNDLNMPLCYNLAPNTNYTITISQNLPPDNCYFYQIPNNTQSLNRGSMTNHINLVPPFSDAFWSGSMTSWQSVVIPGLYFTVKEGYNELTLTISPCPNGEISLPHSPGAGIVCCPEGNACGTICCPDGTTCFQPGNCL